MSVVGIDFGNMNSIIAVARNRGIDVITNEVSNRATPSKVSFGLKQRYLGEAAQTQEISNFKNTVSSLKRIAGRTFQDQEVQNIESKYINADLVEVDGQVGVKVNYLGQETTFSNIQLIGMFLTKLKEITQKEVKIPVSDCVISVPGWYTDVQRRAILDAAEIAGLNPLRLINDTTAAALGYGITKTDLPEDKPRHVVFCDIGHSSYSVAVVAYLKGQLTIKSTAYDRHFGGRNFDEVLVDHLNDTFKEKYKIDVKTNDKALLRLRTAAEKLKKVLSANPAAPISIESIMNDKDVSAIVKREEFEEWASEVFDRVEIPLAQALEDAQLTPADIDSIEMVGGSTRIPAIKERISKFFGKEISTTLNQDEAVARGAALQCAIVSPVFKVREFATHDVTPYSIKITWAKVPEEDDTEIVVFNKNNAVPSTKILTFHRRDPFDLEAVYAEPSQIPTGINPWIGRFSIKKVEPQSNNEPAQVKVKARLNVHGIVSVETAYTVEEKVEEAKPEGEAPMEVDGEKKEEKKPEAKKVKKLAKKADLPVVSGTSSLDRSILDRYREFEAQMSSTDRLVFDTEEKKNALEEYVYDMRSKLDGIYSDFVEPGQKDSFIAKLNETEDWLYGEGEDALKSAYAEKLDELKKTGNPIMERYRESEERPRAERLLRESIALYTANAMSMDERFSHIPTEEKQDVVDRCDRARRWLEEQLAKQNSLPKSATPVLFAKEIMKEREQLVHFASPIMSKPKPAPPPSPAPEAPKTEGDKSEEKPSEAKTEEAKPEETKQNGKKDEMDID